MCSSVCARMARTKAMAMAQRGDKRPVAVTEREMRANRRESVNALAAREEPETQELVESPRSTGSHSEAELPRVSPGEQRLGKRGRKHKRARRRYNMNVSKAAQQAAWAEAGSDVESGPAEHGHSGAESGPDDQPTDADTLADSFWTNMDSESNAMGESQATVVYHEAQATGDSQPAPEAVPEPPAEAAPEPPAEAAPEPPAEAAPKPPSKPAPKPPSKPAPKPKKKKEDDKPAAPAEPVPKIEHRMDMQYAGAHLFDEGTKACTKKPTRMALAPGMKFRVFDERGTNNNCLIYAAMGYRHWQELNLKTLCMLAIDADEIQRVELSHVLTKVGATGSPSVRIHHNAQPDQRAYTVQEFRVSILAKYVEQRFYRAFVSRQEGDDERARLTEFVALYVSSKPGTPIVREYQEACKHHPYSRISEYFSTFPEEVQAKHRGDYVRHVSGYVDLHESVAHFICQVCVMLLAPMDVQAIFGDAINVATAPPVPVKFSLAICLGTADPAKGGPSFTVLQHYMPALDINPDVRPTYVTHYVLEYKRHWWSMGPLSGGVFTRYLISEDDVPAYVTALGGMREQAQFMRTEQDTLRDSGQDAGRPVRASRSKKH